MKPNLIDLYPYVARATQIAIAGDHSLAIVGEAAVELNRLITLENCLSAFAGSPQMRVTATSDRNCTGAELIKRLYENTDNPFVKWDVDGVVVRNFTSTGIKLSAGAAAIFDNVIKKLNPTLKQQVNTIEVARTIQALAMLEEGAKGNANIDMIEAEAIAEAIQYTIHNFVEELINDEGRV